MRAPAALLVLSLGACCADPVPEWHVSGTLVESQCLDPADTVEMTVVMFEDGPVVDELGWTCEPVLDLGACDAGAGCLGLYCAAGRLQELFIEVSGKTHAGSLEIVDGCRSTYAITVTSGEE